MKKLSFMMIAFCLMLSIGVSSCSSHRMTGHGAPMAYTDVKPDQIKADLDFNDSKKVTGEATATYLLGFIRLSGDRKYADVKHITVSTGGILERIGKFTKRNEDKTKSAAIYNALQGSDADIVINPQYEVEKVSTLLGLIKTYKVKVKTYTGKIEKLYQEKVDKKEYDINLKRE